MDGIERFIWASAATMVVLSAVGFLVIDPSTQVHTQFSLDGWTTSYTRNTSLAIFAGAALLAGVVLSYTLNTHPGLTWMKWLAIGVMTLLPIAQLASILEAA